MAYIKKANELICVFVPIMIDKDEKYSIMNFFTRIINIQI